MLAEHVNTEGSSESEQLFNRAVAAYGISAESKAAKELKAQIESGDGDLLDALKSSLDDNDSGTVVEGQEFDMADAEAGSEVRFENKVDGEEPEYVDDEVAPDTEFFVSHTFRVEDSGIEV